VGNLKMVFRGTHAFTFDLPSTAEVEGEDYRTVDVPGFEAVCAFSRLDQLQATDEPAFTHAQAICVTEIEDWDFRGGEFASVLVLPEAVRWVLCFPVACGDGVHYALQTRAIELDGDNVFYTFASLASAALFSASVQAVPDLDSLKFLTTQPGDKLTVIHAKDWSWDEGRNTVYIQPWDIPKIEFVVASDVSVF
jgi:hypothetical protein